MSSEDPDIPSHLRPAIEAMLLAAEGPLGAETLREAIQQVDGTPIAPGWIEAALSEIAGALESSGSGMRLADVAGGYEYRTRASQAPYVHQLYKKPPVRMSKAALEVLAIVAYRQPCTRAAVDQIRGVDSSRTLRTLLERGLIRILGKADDVGRPLLYGTSPGFLAFFGLTSLEQLPTLKEYTELSEEHVVRLQELDETLSANEADGGAAAPPEALPAEAPPAEALPAKAAPEQGTRAEPSTEEPALPHGEPASSAETSPADSPPALHEERGPSAETAPDESST